MTRERNKKRIYIGAVVLICILIAVIGVIGKKKGTQFLDKDGKTFATVYYQDGQFQYDCEDVDIAYAQVAVEEAISILTKAGQSEKEAKREIGRGLKIYTYYDSDISGEMQNSFENIGGLQSGGSVLMNTKGEVLACYSMTGGNYVLEKRYVASTMKPLSAYGPAIEKNLIHWSTLFLDAPLKQIRDENGNDVDWPQSSHYTGTMKTVQDAVAKSNNAIAIRVLEELNMDEELDFLTEKLKFNVEPERKMQETEGTDSILSHIGLGYLTEGDNVLDMTAKYQIFANGGVYYEPNVISKIDKAGKTIYQHGDDTGENVVSEETAYIINRLLKSVVSKGGTGKAAEIEEMDICGKTGTTEGNDDNWFIGMTPDYVCGVWHGKFAGTQKDKNRAPEIFKEIMENRGEERSEEFQAPETVVEKTYCLQSGKIASESCTETSTGFYKVNHLPELCDICNK